MSKNKELAQKFHHQRVKITTNFNDLKITGNAPINRANADTIWYCHHIWFNPSTLNYELSLMVTINEGVMEWDRHLFTSVSPNCVSIV